MTAVFFDGVRKDYGGTSVFEHLTLRFEERTTTAIVGPSGSGKTTLLRLINGLLRPTQGVVQVFGSPLDYARLSQIRRRIGYAVQGIGLFPHLTVKENVVLLARLEGWENDRIEARLEELLEIVELSHTFASRYPHELSGGQQQRVGLARAMMLKPPLLLLDEPFGSLDFVTREEIHREFLRLQKAASPTIILVTHDRAEAAKLAQYIVVLEGGKVVEVR